MSGYCGIVGHHLGRAWHRFWSRLAALWAFLRASWLRFVLSVLAAAYVLAMLVLPAAQVTATRWGALVQLLSAVVLASTIAQFLASAPYTRLEAEDDGSDALDSALYDLQAGQVVDERSSAADRPPNASTLL